MRWGVPYARCDGKLVTTYPFHCPNELIVALCGETYGDAPTGWRVEMTPDTGSQLDLHPDGRNLWYDGDDPDGFVAELKARFGFDPSKSPTGGRLLWGVPTPPRADDPEREWCTAYPFYCPPQHLDAILSDENDYCLGS
jgi:hypothetical protein